jgi:hypothetical protein
MQWKKMVTSIEFVDMMNSLVPDGAASEEMEEDRLQARQTRQQDGQVEEVTTVETNTEQGKLVAKTPEKLKTDENDVEYGVARGVESPKNLDAKVIFTNDNVQHNSEVGNGDGNDRDQILHLNFKEDCMIDSSTMLHWSDRIKGGVRVPDCYTLVTTKLQDKTIGNGELLIV